MALTCCLDKEKGCICEANKICGGVHIIESQCTVHARVQVRSHIHEVGQKRADQK